MQWTTPEQRNKEHTTATTPNNRNESRKHNIQRKKARQKRAHVVEFDVCEVLEQTIESTQAAEVRIVVTNLWEGNERARGQGTRNILSQSGCWLHGYRSA